MKIIITLSLIIIITTLIIIIIIILRVVIVSDIPKTIEILDPSLLTTGDIVGVGYNNLFGYFVTCWSGSIWNHCGLVWREPNTNQVFILEAGAYGGEYNGVFKIPLNEWIIINKNSYMGVSKLRGRKLDTVLLINKFMKRKKYVTLDSYNYNWHRLIRNIPYFKDKRTKYTCYELVVTILQDCNVVKKIYACSSYFPRDIMIGNLPMCSDYFYDNAVLFDTTYYYNVVKASQY